MTTKDNGHKDGNGEPRGIRTLMLKAWHFKCHEYTQFLHRPI